MLITNPRLRTIYIALTGMEAAVLSLLLMLFLRWEPVWTQPPTASLTGQLGLLGVLWASLLVIIFTVDVLAHSDVSDSAYRGIVIGAALLTGLMGVRLLAFPEMPFYSAGWIGETVSALVNFHRGMTPPLFVSLLTIFLWVRASSITSKELNFLGVGISFRLGMLLSLIAGGVLALRVPELRTSSTWVLAIYMSMGLLAVALARSDEKASASSGSPGSPLPLDRLLQLILIIAGVVGGSLFLAQIYSPDAMLATVRFFDPIWALLGRLGGVLLTGFILVLQGIAFGLYWLIEPLLSQMTLFDSLSEVLDNLQFQTGEEPLAQAEQEPWRYAALTLLILRILGVAGLLVLLFGIIYIFLARRRPQDDEEAAEQTTQTGAASPTNPLNRGLERLRRLADLLRQYGLSRQLLDAISVENLYANLSRTARRRGFPRKVAEPPDQYLPQLNRAFPEHSAQLARITNAYMKVHYGDLPVGQEELVTLRRDYDAILEDESKT